MWFRILGNNFHQSQTSNMQQQKQQHIFHFVLLQDVDASILSPLTCVVDYNTECSVSLPGSEGSLADAERDNASVRHAL